MVTPLYDNRTFAIPAGAIVGIIGPNGTGKTTLLRMIVGQEQPDAGTLTVGTTVKLAYVDQSRTDLDPNNSVWEEISGGQEQIPLGDRLVNSRAYVAPFNLAGPDQQKKVGMLSGGERNRAHLAKTLKSGANVLLLDEPGNDLDVNTLRAPKDALEGFAGSALIISHDRWFLDRVATTHAGLRGGQHGLLVSWQLQWVRSRPASPWRYSRPPTPHYLPQVPLGLAASWLPERGGVQ